MLVIKLMDTFSSFYYIPAQEALFKEHFKDLIEQPMPRVIDMIHNVNLVLVNSHPLLEFPRAHMPNSIEVGGLHLKTEEKDVHPVSDVTQKSNHSS